MSRAVSGEQWTLRRGPDTVTVVEVGGGLRAWTRDGLSVLAGYTEDEMCLAGRGQLLMPWPNRIRDGKYVHDGTAYQLALTEPRFGNASHGLVRWASWSLLGRTESTEESALTVGYALHAQPGWPGTLDLRVTYALADAGLSVRTDVVNTGSQPVPFGYGAHPYVAVGDVDPAQVGVHVPADRYVEVDERMLPTAVRDVAGTAYDFRVARPLGTTTLDTAYTGLRRDEDGRWRVTLSGLGPRPDVTVWGDAAFAWTQVFTGKAAAEGEHGIAVEPMSCPADAFGSGTDVVRLEPGASWSGTWGVSPAARVRPG